MRVKVSDTDGEEGGETETEEIKLARRQQLIQSILGPTGIHVPAEALK